ncbi:MAG: short-chain dehydrogenase, partial [Acidimicrobiaceae bacterium]|nr:short-chain dehydrogenase [Acidimicrobiaceae bacterium]
MTEMGKRLEGKAVFITGAASGIGRQSAVRFATEGAQVAVVDVDADGAATVADEVIGAGGQAVALRADVSSEGEVAAAVADAEEAFGRLDVVFNNAGIMHGDDGDAQATEETVWD